MNIRQLLHEELTKIKDKVSPKVCRMIENGEWESPNPVSFLNSLELSQHKQMLTPYTIDELRNMRLYKLKGLNIGYALKKPSEDEGYTEIVAVHNNEPSVKAVGDALVSSAIQNGGLTLDHFDGYLSDLYSRNGFVEYKRDKYDPQYDPKGEFKDRYGEKDVIYRTFDSDSGKHKTSKLSLDSTGNPKSK